MTNVFLVRHAEAEGNLYRRIRHYNSTITENGRRQLQALAKRFESVHLDAAYSSDLYRARTTAEAVCAPHNLTVTLDPRLREVGMGQWEDQPWALAARNDPEQARNFGKNHLAWNVPGAERYADAAARFSSAVFELANKHEGETIAIFAHGSVIRTFLCLASGLPLTEMKKIHHSDNTGVSLLEIEGQSVHIVYQNDNSHLSPEISTLARQSWWKQHQTDMDPCLWFQPLDLEQFGDVYLEARREAWDNIHHDLTGFDGEGFLEEAKELSKASPHCVLACMLEEEQAGILQMNPEEDSDALWISFFYMMPQFRGHYMGVQLIGEAVSTCRSMERNYLRLRVSTRNERAQRFYERYGFHVIGTDPGVVAPLLIMEKYIGY